MSSDANAQQEALVFLSFFENLADPRQPGKIIYALPEILLLNLLAVLAGAENFVDVARFGQKKVELLRRFLPFEGGTPSHDQLCDIFATIDAAQFQRCFVNWVTGITGMPADVIAIDGKTSRRTADKRKGKGAIHMVSAFAARQRMVLGQVKVADKSNEIIAIPALLDMLEIKGAVITIDAMGCQRDIAQKVIDKKADYILALKGNQGSLREDVEVFVAEQKANGFKDTKISQDTTVDADHGRIETRTCTVLHDVKWLQDRHNWPGLKSVVMVESERQIPATAKDPAKIERETRFYIASLVWIASQVAPAVRAHWMIENGLHWVMDMMFRDDECRVRTENAPANFTTIKHMALNLIRLKPSGKNDSLRVRRKVAAWDDDYLASLVGG